MTDYTPAVPIKGLVTCGACGAVVADKTLHSAWHKGPDTITAGGSTDTKPEYGFEYEDASASDGDIFEDLVAAKAHGVEVKEWAVENDCEDDYAGQRLMVRTRTVTLGPWVPFVPVSSGE